MYIIRKDIEKNVKTQEVKPIHKMFQGLEIPRRFALRIAKNKTLANTKKTANGSDIFGLCFRNARRDFKIGFGTRIPMDYSKWHLTIFKKRCEKIRRHVGEIRI